MLKQNLIAAAIAVGMAAPASAAVLDFTSSSIDANSSNLSVFGIGYDISASGGNLVDAYHYTQNGCAPLVCSGGSGSFDVGLGVDGGVNPEEIDGNLGADEYVQVKFQSVVRFTGFASLLTYFDSNQANAEERGVLEVWNAGALVDIFEARPDSGDVGGTFPTVGFASNTTFNVIGDEVRFRALGVGASDDGSANVTAAALQVEAVPLPAGLPLMLAGIGAFGWMSRRKKKLANA